MEKIYLEDALSERQHHKTTSAFIQNSLENSKNHGNKVKKTGFEVIQMFKHFEKLQFQNAPEQEELADQEHLASEGMKKETGDDFGYHGILDSNEEECERGDYLRKRKKEGFYEPGNFVRSLNDVTYEQCPMGLILDLLKENSENNLVINVENPFPLYEARNSKNEAGQTQTKKYTKTGTQIPENEEFLELVKNTENSVVVRNQIIKINENNLSEALKIKSEYAMKKICYEVDLVKMQLDKFEEYSNSHNTGKNTKLSSEEPFKVLQLHTKELLREYNEFILGKNLNRLKVKVRLHEFSDKVRLPLTQFMIGILNAYEKLINEKRAANEKVNSYSKWKTILRQLVSLWDVANSNGIDMRTTPRYLILKRFLLLRALAIQNNTPFVLIQKAQQIETKTTILSVFATNRNTILHPIAIIRSNNQQPRPY